MNMPVNRNVCLTDELAQYVKTKVSSGRDASSSEVVREALRLMEQRDHKEAERLDVLRRAWQQGFESGDAGEVDFEILKLEARARLLTINEGK